jgi:hypothetical protein
MWPPWGATRTATWAERGASPVSRQSIKGTSRLVRISVDTSIEDRRRSWVGKRLFDSKEHPRPVGAGDLPGQVMRRTARVDVVAVRGR